MWLDGDDFKQSLDNSIELLPVKEEKDWRDMLDLRIKIEIAFGLTNIETIKKLVNDIKVKSTKLNGQWFLLKKQNKVIGEFGLVPFTFENKIVGRIQDVDIASEYQGNGFGNILLSYICNAAIENKYKALCLMAKADDLSISFEFSPYFLLENSPLFIKFFNSYFVYHQITDFFYL